MIEDSYLSVGVFYHINSLNVNNLITALHAVCGWQFSLLNYKTGKQQA